MENLHPLLMRQISSFLTSDEHLAKSWSNFLEMVNRAYAESDADLIRLERSLQIASDGMRERDGQLLSLLGALPYVSVVVNGNDVVASCHGTASFADPSDLTQRLVGKDLACLVSPSAAERLRTELRAARELNVARTLDLKLPGLAEGSTYGVLIAPSSDRQAILLCREIDRVRESMVIPKTSWRYLDKLIHNSSDVVSVVDSSGMFTFVSDSIERVYGYDSGEMLGQSAFAFIHPDERSEIVAVFSNGVSQGQGFETSAEFRFLHRNQTWRWSEAFGKNLLDDPDVSGIVINSRDITARREGDELLRRSEGLYRVLFQSSPNIMVVYEIESLRITTVNDAMISRYGYSEDELLVMTIEDLHLPEEVAALREDLARRPAASARAARWKHRTKHGTVFEVDVVSQDVPHAPHPSRILLIADASVYRAEQSEIQVASLS